MATIHRRGGSSHTKKQHEMAGKSAKEAYSSAGKGTSGGVATSMRQSDARLSLDRSERGMSISASKTRERGRSKK